MIYNHFVVCNVVLDLSKTQLAKVDIVFAAETVADTKTFIMTTPAATDFLNNGEELPSTYF